VATSRNRHRLAAWRSCSKGYRDVRAVTRLAGLGAALVVLALLAAWQVPPHLDWTRYRGAIASFASARMGRPVTLGGQVRLLLLPDAMLVADGVTLADRGDGVSARIGSLRLRVALGPLLRGRLVARRLELDDPAVVLPWPLPRGAGGDVPRRVAGGFSARVEGGSLRISGLAFSGVTGGVQTDPDTGAFSAQGVARLAGLPWRFTALIGAPGPDGVSLLTVTLDGQDAALGTGGTLRGRVLAGGTVKGVLSLRGDNLARLVPGPATAWRVQGAVGVAGRGQRHAAAWRRAVADRGVARRAGDAGRLERVGGAGAGCFAGAPGYVGGGRRFARRSGARRACGAGSGPCGGDGAGHGQPAWGRRRTGRGAY
jgi:hypothetical protein